ncbi:hypothetical protein [Leptotrichia buccalis]
MSKKINLKIYNTSTLKQTSKDDNNEEYMTESQIKVINFDSVGGDKYTRNNNLSIQLKTNDVLFLHNDERYTFIEFKNGKLLDKSNRIDIKKLKDIELKILNSMFVLGDIEGKSLNTLKEITNYILVYNEDKNLPNEKNSILEIGNYFVNQGSSLSVGENTFDKDEIICFGLEKFKGYCFKMYILIQKRNLRKNL